MGKAKQIELPKKVLREPLTIKPELLQQKTALEENGWKFEHNEEKDQWSAEKQFGKWVDGFKNVNDLNRLFRFCEKLELKYQKAENKPVTPTQAYYEIPLSQIDVSQTEPQSIRRLGFTPENLADITESVRQKGVLEPVLLRPLADGFELCAGERRFLAATNAGLTKIPAIVRELSDEEVDDIQLHENLHREEPHPLEEAATYDYMERKRGFDLNEISARAAKTVRYIAGRRELLKLSEKVKDIFRKNEITLSHALEIAKYSESDQDEILSYAFSNFGHTSQALYPMSRFIEAIEQHYLLQLSKAPFSIKSNELHPDGLACVNCSDRTGAKALLFPENLDKKDSCLNRKCYNGKVNKYIQIQREKIVVETKNVPAEKAAERAKAVPLVSSNWYLNDEQKKSGEKILLSGEYEQLKSNNCDRAEYAIFADGNRKGQKVIICKKSSKCIVHWKSYASSLPKAEKTADVLEVESLERKNRKEEIIDVNVGETVRRKVLAEAAKKFDAQNTIFNHPQKAEDYLYGLTARLWHYQCNWNSEMADIIRTALGVSPKRLPHAYSYTYRDSIAELTPDERSRLFFLILHADLGHMSEGGQFESQKEIKQIAEDFEVDYQMIDALERLKYASEKHEKYTKEFHNYLVKLENGDRKAEIPRVYSPEYKPKEK